MSAQDLLPIVQLSLGIGNLIIMLYALKKFLSSPKEQLSDRVSVLEVKQKEMENSLYQGNDRFRSQSEINEVIIKSTLALVEFEIQYCLTEHKTMSGDLEQAKNELHRYLAKSKGGV